MKNCEYILDYWSKSISVYNKLNFDEAQELYKRMNKSQGKDRELLREKLITGTLYLIPKNIKKSLFPYIVNSSYDMNDIINAFNETWINVIDSGKLLEVSCFSLLFRNDFYSKVINQFAPSVEFSNYFNINKKFFIYILSWYVNKNINGTLVTLDSFLEYFNTYREKYIDEDYIITDKDLVAIYNMVETTYEYLKRNGLDNKKISERMFLLINNLLLDSVLNTTDNNIKIYDMEYYDINYLRKFIEEKILYVIFNDIPFGQRRKDILRYHYGLDDGEYKTFEETGKLFGISGERVREIENNVIKIIRDRKGKVLPLLEDYFYLEQKRGIKKIKR